MAGFGLIAIGRETADKIALRGVRMTARLAAMGARVCVEQTFVNQEPASIEAVYTIPLPDGAAVCGLEIVTGDRVLTGVIEEREKAEKKYDEAMREGHGAFMAESWRPDVFSTRVGNLKPGQAVTVRMTYVMPLTATDRTIRVSFPTTVAPRYVSQAGMDPVDAAVEGDALNPPHVLSVPYGLTLEVDIALGVGLKSVGSPTHGVKVERSGDAGNPAAETYKVSMYQRTIAMDRDVVLEIELAQEAAPTAVLERATIDGREERFVAVTFVPTFDASELSPQGQSEVIFVLDCSGSMGGDSIGQAKAALSLCLRSLSLGDRFNIVRFGNTFELMAREPLVYSDKTLAEAMRYVSRIDANLGGTEIYEPLEAVLKTPTRSKTRDVIVLTDGQVSNEPAVIALAGKHRSTSRIFTFGIGAASSATLVNGLARVTGGAAEFVSAGERIEEKVLRTFSRMASPMVTDVRVDWKTSGAKACDVHQTPAETPALFDGDALCVYGRAPQDVSEVSLRCTMGGKEKSWTVPVSRRVAGDGDHATAPLLWARSRIRELEDRMKTVGDRQERKLAAEVVRISVAYNVLSTVTSFVAVEHRSVEERVEGKAALRRVPIAIPTGWHGMAAGGAAACMAPAAAPVAFDALMDACLSEDDASTLGLGANASAPAGDGLLKRLFGKAQSARSARRKTREASTPEQPPAATELQNILLAQSAEGWFNAGDWIRGTGGSVNGHDLDRRAWRKELEGLGVTDMRIIDTAMTLRILRVCFDAEKALWRRAFTKGLDWLARQSPAAEKWVTL